MVFTQQFGGEWTEKKLKVLEAYLKAYLVALRDQSWIRQRVYIDAFAGTGTRKTGEANGESSDQAIPELLEPATAEFLDGSVKRALALSPSFDRYIFVEKTRWKADQLRALATGYQNLTVEVVHGDANAELLQVAKTWNPKDRGVLFLDPYGMALEWKTLEAIATTRALDVWLLFPVGPANRVLLDPTKQMPATWERRLTIFFGSEDWKDAFYSKSVEPSLFGHQEVVTRTADYGRIEKYFREKLKLIFPFVHPKALKMVNEKGVPLYLFMFMISTKNRKAWSVGKEIAGHLLKSQD